MVNRGKRQEAKDLLLRFVNGSITNDTFEESFPKDANDKALSAIYRRLWFLWDDRYTHTLKGPHTLGDRQQAMVDRCVTFLDSDLEYQWAKTGTEASFLLLICRILHLRKTAKKLEQRQIEQLETIGDINAWPFLSASEYAREIKKSKGRTSD